jgi:flagellar biosynthesis protein FliP
MALCLKNKGRLGGFKDRIIIVTSLLQQGLLWQQRVPNQVLSAFWWLASWPLK